MLNKFFLAIIFLISTYSGNAQESEDILDLQPLCHSDTQAIKLLKNISTAPDENVIIINFSPNMCPRCEGLIWNLAKILLSKGHRPALLLDIDDRKAGQAYLDDVKGYKSEYFSYVLFDVSGLFKRLINIDPDRPIPYPLVYKIDKKTGRFVYLNYLGGKAINEAFCDTLLSSDVPIEGCAVRNVDPSEALKAVAPNTFWVRRRALAVPSGVANPMMLSASNGKFYFTDLTTGKIVMFNSDGNDIKVLKSSRSEMFYMVDTSDAKLMEKIEKDFIVSGISKVIYRKPYYSNDGIMGIPASIPKIWYTNDTDAFYANYPCIIFKDTNNNLLRIEGIPMPKNSLFVPSHQYYLPVWGENNYATFLYKGWPAVGYELDTSRHLENPFVDSFYINSPLVDFIRGKDYSFLGSLPNIYRSAQLGYYYCSPMYTSSSLKLFLVETTSGELQIFDRKDILNGKNRFYRQQLFPEKTDEIMKMQISKAKTHPMTMSYLNSYKDLLLSCFIMDIKFYNNNLFVLINNKKSIEIRKYSADGKQLLAKKEFPLENEKNLKGAVLSQNPETGEIGLYGLEKIKTKFYICSNPLNI